MTQLHPVRMHGAEYKRNEWFVVPEFGTPFEALLDPGYWAHVAMKLKPCDEIVVHAEDGAYYGRLMVRDAGRLYARVAKIAYIEFEKDDTPKSYAPIPEGYEIRWRGPKLKWCVLRGKDCLKDEMERDHAHTWLVEHLKVVGT